MWQPAHFLTNCSCDAIAALLSHMQSIISPHLYPPSITKSTFLGEKLWKQSNTSFGYLQSKGFCDTNNRCYKFPIVIGETGSAFKEEDDKTWLMDFAAFAMARVSGHACRGSLTLFFCFSIDQKKKRKTAHSGCKMLKSVVGHVSRC